MFKTYCLLLTPISILIFLNEIYTKVYNMILVKYIQIYPKHTKKNLLSVIHSFAKI